ncbi:LytR/AlgR family response regulator transcription factor [Acinetobacter sp. ANC 3791]|uniref:LytR/AlgR family response regulator transcription factor n=1 Tax=Acinetobacter sp. ANC 3791 TaxID=2529836 RepID=UPI00103B6AB2|nr:LytTR family DNA-binding domain-containing protein [Acinetobacter sp. ANC 3791]TCB85338.1 response regulator transcription factor [Acinetobacter sp. ANC 3791]
MDILICDDEPLAVERLVRLVSDLGHQVVATAEHGGQVYDLVLEYEPDVVLLDIQMPEIDGLSCARQLAHLEIKPAIIFCTAYDQHALQAFQSQAQAYLLKPIAKNELREVLDQVCKPNQAQVSQFQQSSSQISKKQRQHITAKSHRGVELIPIEQVYYFLADQKYVTIRHQKGSVLIDETLKDLELEFADQFIRIHRNALVSIKFLDGIESICSGQYQVRLRDVAERLVISRRHLPQLRESIQQL